jgi:hypothetical protein
MLKHWATSLGVPRSTRMSVSRLEKSRDSKNPRIPRMGLGLNFFPGIRSSRGCRRCAYIRGGFPGIVAVPLRALGMSIQARRRIVRTGSETQWQSSLPLSYSQFSS